MQYFILFCLSFFIIGCSGGTTSSNQSTNPSINKCSPSTISIDEPLFYQQWNLAKNESFYNKYNIDNNAHIDAFEAWKYSTGKCAKVAIIDDSLDLDNDEFKNRTILTYNINDDTTNVENTNGNSHGTVMAGIIGAQSNAKGILGVAPEVDLIFIKIDLDNASDSDIIKAFLKADELGADVISNSWGSYGVSQSVSEMINALAKGGRGKKGTIIIFASGNDGCNLDESCLGYKNINDESEIESVIGVGATTSKTTRATYSNYGSNLDITSPGGDFSVGISSTDQVGDKGYNFSAIEPDFILSKDASFVGTSASAPMVSGVAALIVSVNPNLTSSEVKDIIQKSADKVGSDEYIEGRNIFYGYGKINAKKAVMLAKESLFNNN